jgi:hypothetical protein
LNQEVINHLNISRTENEIETAVKSQKHHMKRGGAETLGGRKEPSYTAGGNMN